MKRRGFTVAEALVALAISSIVVIAIYQVWVGTSKQEEGNLARTESFQTAQLALDYIQSDFSRLFIRNRADLGPFSELSPRAQFEFDTAVSLGTSGPTLYKPERVSYGLEPGPGGEYSWLTRNGRRIANVKLKSLLFSPRLVEAMDGSSKLHLLQVQLTAVDSSGKLETPLTGLFLAPVVSEALASPWWPQDAVPYKE
jgi:type II secretory pathway pseudopilin PulG